MSCSLVEFVGIGRDGLAVAQNLPSVDFNELLEVKINKSIKLQTAKKLLRFTNGTFVLVGAARVSIPLLHPKIPAGDHLVKSKHRVLQEELCV